MGKFIPVSQDEHNEIVELFNSDLGVNTIMQKYNRDYYTIKKIWLTTYNEGQFKSRTSRLCRLHKIGGKNPMSGRTGRAHHAFVPREVNSSGYILVESPDWYSGARDGNKVYEHILVYCEHNGMAFIPKGNVIHHLDENKSNNHPDNLVMMSIQDHRRIHAWLNKVQRLSSSGVGGSAPEAQDTLKGDDIV